MSKKITHEQARIEAFSYNCESIEVLLKYINQQEKQEKLLELYKELIIELDLELEEFKRFGDKAKNPALDKLRIKNETFVFEGNASSLFKQKILESEVADIVRELNEMMYEYGYSKNQFQKFLKDVHLNKFTDKEFNMFGIKNRQEVIDYAKAVKAWKFDSFESDVDYEE